MGVLGSKRAIDAATKNCKLTEEDKQWLKDNAESFICSANGTYCLKGCKFNEGKDCQRLINNRKQFING